MNIQAVSTKLGVIFTRDALVLKSFDMSCYPFEAVLTASLNTLGCRPITKEKKEYEVEFYFYEISCISIYKFDDYPCEKYTKSSFDEIVDTDKKEQKRFVVSTYDHVFDITGKCLFKIL